MTMYVSSTHLVGCPKRINCHIGAHIPSCRTPVDRMRQRREPPQRGGVTGEAGHDRCRPSLKSGKNLLEPSRPHRRPIVFHP